MGWRLSSPSDVINSLSKTSSTVDIETTDCGDTKRVKRDQSNLYTKTLLKKPEDVIICEKQEELFCGRHVLRALAQRLDLFDDEYLKGIGRHLASSEQICRDNQAVPITEYYYEKTGEYDIQILDIALRNIFNIDLVQIATLEPKSDSLRSLILSNSQHIQAFLIQQGYHYYCLRRYRSTKDYFFKIDSLCPRQYQPIHHRDILRFLSTLLESKCNIYVTIQHDENNVNQTKPIDNITTRLWSLPDSPADCECFSIFDESNNQ